MNNIELREGKAKLIPDNVDFTGKKNKYDHAHRIRAKKCTVHTSHNVDNTQ